MRRMKKGGGVLWRDSEIIVIVLGSRTVETTTETMSLVTRTLS